MLPSGLTRIVVLLMFVLGVCCAANTQETRGLSRDGAWEIGGWVGQAFGAEIGGPVGGVQVSMAAVRFGRVILDPKGEGKKRGTLEYTFDAIPVFVTTRPQTVWGGGFSPIGLKWNFDGSRRWHPYLEASGGAMFTPQNVPPGRTDNFNFTAAGGGGLMFFIRPRQAMTLSLRYWHLSNAWLGAQNPSFNTLQIVIGYSWIK